MTPDIATEVYAVRANCPYIVDECFTEALLDDSVISPSTMCVRWGVRGEYQISYGLYGTRLYFFFFFNLSVGAMCASTAVTVLLAYVYIYMCVCISRQ